jgi:dTDP-4-amino-4,6-dideoxygalactose transaminase
MTAPSVPLCDLQAQYRPLQGEIERAVCRVLSSGQAILGPEVSGLEQEVASYCGTTHGVGCGSGTDAISLALHALGIGAGDEVIIPPFTFFATAGCVVRTGATPVFADIDPVSFNMDPDLIADCISPRTKAIMPVHLYGQCADMKMIMAIAAKHNIPVIEDAAQAFGAEYDGKKAGSMGALGCFSFYPTKNLGTYGDAGLTVTNNPEWAERMQIFRLHGMKPKYHHRVVGWMGRIDAVQAAILRVKLPYVDEWIDQRRAVAGRYDDLICDSRLDGWLTRPKKMKNCRHTFNQYVVRVGDGLRDSLVKHLQTQKIGYEIYYPLPLHMQECLKNLGYGAGDFPVSEAAAKCVLALPMYPEISESQQSRVVEAVAEFRHQTGVMRRAA